jgi:protein-tyrosine phosphatase
VDDGAQGTADALKLVQMAYENGTRTIFLTHHYRGKYKENDPGWLKEVYDLFCTMVAEKYPDMKLYLGSEIHYESDAPQKLSKRKILTINNSQFILLEFSSKSVRSQVINGVMEMVQYGYTPIIAHAERYPIFREDASLTREVLEMGALIQLNADSVMGKHGHRVKAFCAKLLKEEKAHFIATDAHDCKMRPPLLRKCYMYVYKKYGAQYAAELFGDNALAVLEDRLM